MRRVHPKAKNGKYVRVIRGREKHFAGQASTLGWTIFDQVYEYPYRMIGI